MDQYGNPNQNQYYHPPQYGPPASAYNQPDTYPSQIGYSASTMDPTYMTEHPMLKSTQQEVKDLDTSLSKDYFWYRLWLWFDFVLNVAWIFFFMYSLTYEAGTRNVNVYISGFFTAFILITIGYGLSAYNSKIPERQARFITLLKWLIVLYIIDIPILMLSDSIGMLAGRVSGTVISILVLYTARNLHNKLIRRTGLIKAADRMDA